MPDPPDVDGAIDWLVASDEPAVRYRARTWLMDGSDRQPAVRRDRAQIPDGPIVAVRRSMDTPPVASGPP